jgi:hypothetical protein
LSDGFENKCEGWTAVGGPAEIRAVAIAHSGAGACEICAGQPAPGTTLTDFYITHSATATRAGRVVSSAWIERPGDASGGTTSPASGTVHVYPASTDGTSGASTWSASIASGTWTNVTDAAFGGLPVTAGEVITVGFGVQKPVAGDCIIVDDVASVLQ